MNYTMEELVPIVAKLSEKYTSKESTSVTYEQAAKFMEAIIYCIHEMEYQKSNQLVASTETPSAMDAYTRGNTLVKEKVSLTQKKYNRMIPSFQDYGNLAYRDTFCKGIPAFFRVYDTQFSPQDTILTLDYPTLIQADKNKSGIDAIADYVSYIEMEQIFLQKMPVEYIINVLLSYHSDYKGLFINIASVVLRDFLSKMMLKSTPAPDLTSLPKEELYSLLYKLLSHLIKTEYNDNNYLLQYLAADLDDYVAILVTSNTK